MILRDWVITIDIIRIYLTILRLHINIYSWYYQASTCLWVKMEKVEYQNLLLVYNDPCLIVANNLSLKSNSCYWKMLTIDLAKALIARVRHAYGMISNIMIWILRTTSITRSHPIGDFRLNWSNPLEAEGYWKRVFLTREYQVSKI